ncbi:antistasin-like [Liolophura sinensis]|uniref:antistasin-like n=1 Tax=Liolophura sinensis TaxID=3198878 RepID=UPI003158F811
MLKLCLLLGVCACVWSAPRPRGSCLLLCGGNGVTCMDGYECKSNGCGSECFQKSDYKLTQKDCPPLSCLLACPLGLVRDKQGCEICMCKYNLLELGY